MIKTVLRLFAGLLGIAILLPALWLGGTIAYLDAARPDYQGTAAVPGLGADVTVSFDDNAIPLIEAATIDDGIAALGYLHARERLFQMETSRRIGAGRLAEILGPPVIGFDKYMRTLGLYRLAEGDYAALGKAARDRIDAYTRGVNAYLAGRKAPLPIEFQLLMFEPEPWRPADSLVWLRLMAVQLSNGWRGELNRAALADAIGGEAIDMLYPPYPGDAPVTLSGLPRHTGTDWAGLARRAPSPLGPNTASNAWVLSAARTTTGAPILANDPHLGLQAPIQWYLARIDTPQGTLAGGTIPPAPFFLSGHNGKAAWGLTTTGADVQDVVIEKLDPAAPDERYLTPDGSEPFETRSETLRVRFGEDIDLRIRSTRNGPVLSDIDEDMAAHAGDGHVVALRFADLAPHSRTAEALFGLNAAATWQQAIDATRLVQGPVQNVHFASTDGTIGLIAPGRIPIRSRGDGLLPVKGWTGEDEWTGYIPFDELPTQSNPPDGAILNANNAIVGPDYRYLITGDWAAPYRAQRLREIVKRKPRLSPAENRAMQLDMVSAAAAALVPPMIAIEPQDRAAQSALSLLAKWDYAMHRDLAAPLIFRAWLRELGPALWADELGDLAGDFDDTRPQAVSRILTEKTAWCDNTQTPDRQESCSDILLTSLSRALDNLRAVYGPDMDDWRWGDAHPAPLKHRPLGSIPILDHLADIAVETDGGNWTLQRASSYGGQGVNFPAVHGAGLRALHDLSDLDAAQYITATGQSGNPLSPYFGRFAPLWAQGQYVTLPKPGKVVKPLGTLTLYPARTSD